MSECTHYKCGQDCDPVAALKREVKALKKEIDQRKRADEAVWHGRYDALAIDVEALRRVREALREVLEAIDSQGGGQDVVMFADATVQRIRAALAGGTK